MTSRISLFFIVFLCLFGLSYVAVAQEQTEQRELETFTQIHVSGSVKVHLKPGNKEMVVLRVKGTDISDVETQVRGGKLSVGLKNGSYHNVSIEADITYKTLESLHTSGSCNVTAEGTIKSESLHVVISGSGSTRADIDVNHLEINISGSGNVELQGKTNKQTIELSGSGNVRNLTLSSDTAKIQISGSAKAEVKVANALDARISGSGAIRYKGNPDQLIVKSTGSGSVRKID
jgi:hypothetical protein